MVRFFAQEGMLMVMSIERVEPSWDPAERRLAPGWYVDGDDDICFVTPMGDGKHDVLFVRVHHTWLSHGYTDMSRYRPAPAFTLRYTP